MSGRVFIPSAVEKYINDNPDGADNIEDMLNWTCEKFELSEEEIDAVMSFIRKNTDLT